MGDTVELRSVSMGNALPHTEPEEDIAENRTESRLCHGDTWPISLCRCCSSDATPTHLLSEVPQACASNIS